jgi:VanZ family protein
MMAARVRRSMGTNTLLNRLLFRKARPERDLEDFRNGVGFSVSAVLQRIEDIGVRGSVAGGRLILVQGEPVSWRDAGGPMQLTGPFELHETGGTVPFFAHFTKCLLSTGQGDYQLSVPRLDIDLVRLALASGPVEAVQPQPAAQPDSSAQGRQVMRIAANFAMFLYFIAGLTSFGASLPFTVVKDAALLAVWVVLIALVAARLTPTARTHLGGMLFRDPRVVRDALFCLLYAGGLLVMPWIPTALINIWAWGIILWVVVAAVTLVVRRTRGVRPTGA